MNRVLIIEDNEQNMYLTTFILETNHCEVFQARNGRDGIAMARKLRPDLIILDIQLPEIDGITVARELNSLPETGSIPIMAVTSYAMPGDRERILAAGCRAYIEKPINPEHFVREAEKFLPEKPGQD